MDCANIDLQDFNQPGNSYLYESMLGRLYKGPELLKKCNVGRNPS